MSSHYGPASRPVRRNGKWLLAALCVAAAAVLALLWPSIDDWVTGPDDGGPLSAVEMTIAVPTAAQLKACPADIDVTALDRATTAVAATLDNTTGPSATFVADHWFRGGPADRVIIKASTGAELAKALAAAKLDAGRVLIASRSGEVLMCGESGPHDAQRGTRYVHAVEQSK